MKPSQQFDDRRSRLEIDQQFNPRRELNHGVLNSKQEIVDALMGFKERCKNDAKPFQSNGHTKDALFFFMNLADNVLKRKDRMKIECHKNVSWILMLMCVAQFIFALTIIQAVIAEESDSQSSAPENTAPENRVKKVVDGIVYDKYINEKEAGKVTIEVETPRPLAEMVDLLQERYHTIITYEDAPYEHPSDIMEIKFPRKDLDHPAPGTMPMTIIPRPALLKTTFARPIEKGQPPDFDKVIPEIIAANDAAGNPGKFTYEKDGYGLHIIPYQVRVASGDFKKIDSILKVHISMPVEERSAIKAIQEMCSAISQAIPYKIIMGTVPYKSFRYHNCKVGAENEAAIEVLERIIVFPYTWQLLYGISDKSFALNIYPMDAKN